MSIFNEVSASNSEDRNYPYYKYIRSPPEIGVSTKGDLTTLGTNIRAIGSYVDVLTDGNQNEAQKTWPLGNKYFMSTGATCTAPDGSSQPRYVYINNVTDGSVPLIAALGKGLVPGTLLDMTYLNPMKLFTAFSSDTNCQQITMNTRDVSNREMMESQYVLNNDISDYNPCWFPNRVNPVTNEGCTESMTNPRQLPKDPGVQLYATCIGIVGIYILYSLLRNR